ncbi:MAG: amidohydrolase family protein [Chloroflexota bacterium]
MIIDAHAHVFDEPWLPGWFWKMLNNIMGMVSGLGAEKIAELRKQSCDPSGDIMVKSMAKAGVDKAIVCVVDIGLLDPREDNGMPIEEINRRSYEMVKRHPGKLYLSAGVDPRRKNAREIAEAAAKEWGAVSLKLQPTAGWFPNDKIAAYPLYEKCAELGLPLDFHTGPQFHPFKSVCGHPRYIEDVAADFPELTIQCTHSGDVLFHEMVAVAKAHHNVILDFASWQRWLGGSRHTALEMYRALRFMMDMVGPRMMFASDWDGFIVDDEYGQWVDACRRMPGWVKEGGVEFTPEEMDGFFSGNARRLLKL